MIARADAIEQDDGSCMRLPFVVIAVYVLIHCPASIALSQDTYALSNVTVKLIQTGSILDITKYKTFDIGSSEAEHDQDVEAFAIGLLEARGFTHVEHQSAQLSFVYFLLSQVIQDSTEPWIAEGHQSGDVVLRIILSAVDQDTVAKGYQDVDARRWGAEASAAITPALLFPTLDNEGEEGPILRALYQKLLAQLIDQCIPQR